MPWSLFTILPAMPTFALILFRLTGFMLAAPLYAGTVVPMRIRGALTIALAAMIFPMLADQAPAELSLSAALVGGVGELFIGLTIGLALAAFLVCAEVGGLIVGRQAGIALGNVFDPTRNEQVTIVSQVYSIVVTTMFLLAGGHRAAMAALLDTFKVMPLLSFPAGEPVVVLLVEVLTAAFIVGIRLAGPVLIALFLTALAMGFLSRTMPQMNILSVGFTLRAMVALGVASLALVHSRDMLLDAIWDALAMVRESMGLDPNLLRLVG